MQFFLKHILDVIFPQTENAILVKNKSTSLKIKISSHNTPAEVVVTTLLSYKDLVVRAFIHELKYNNSKDAALSLAKILDDFLIEEISSKSLLQNKKYCIIPLPLSKKRMHDRGFNQISEVLTQLIYINSEYIKYINSHILIRSSHTKPQTKLSKEERLVNVKGAFSLHPKAKLYKDTHYIIIDDVTTTGATLQSAKKPLLNTVRAENITLLALARA